MSVEVLVPPLGTNVDRLTLAAWLVEEGTVVEAGQPLFSVETDKATLEVEAPGNGVLSGVTAKAGDEVAVLSRIAYLLSEQDSDLPVFHDPDDEDEADDPNDPGLFCVLRHPRAYSDREFISPRARRLAEEEDFNWSGLAGSGPEHAIIERDIRAALAARATSGPGYSQVEPLTGTRAIIAQRMLASATSAALVTLTTEVDATELVGARDRVNAGGTRVSFNDLFAWLLGKALTEHPRLNTQLDGEVIRHGGPVHVGIAVDTERGLLVPVVRDVHRKTLREIAADSADLIRSVREGIAAPETLRGGTFTLTNLGAFGIDAFTPLPNLPEGAILGVGRIKPSPAVVEGALCVRQQVWLSLTFDHRLLDGAPAARFLQRFAEMLQDRELLESA